VERVFPWLAVIFASVIAIVGISELRMRWDEGELALEPTAIPSPTDQTTPGAPATPTQAPAMPAVPTTPAQTLEPATAEPTVEPTASPAPTAEPTAEPEEPSPPIESPVVPEPEPMPHTGGGAVGGGTALFGLAMCVRYVMRRSYSS
jgi:hypothetical protein